MRALLRLARYSLPVGLLALAPALAHAEKLTVDQAVAEALRNSARLEAARQRAAAADDSARALGRHMLPSLHLFDEQRRYAEPFEVSFGASQFTVYDADTNTLVLSAEQPLTGLLVLRQSKAGLSAQAGAAEESVKTVEAAVREEVEADYLRLFEARALADIARVSEQQLGDQLTVIEARMRSGVATHADLLRVRVAAANARQNELNAEAQEQTVRAALLALLGRRPDEAGLELEEPAALEERGEATPALSAALDRALAARPEIAAADRSAEAAGHQASARKLALVPQISLVGAYTHIEGEELAPKNAGYVGLRADWSFWDWGARWIDARAAEHETAVARAEAEETRRRVGADVAARLADESAAAAAVDVARATIASAEEAYRVTDALLKAGSATTTDLLDAQSALSQARLNLVRARYQRAVARVALDRALARP